MLNNSNEREFSSLDSDSEYYTYPFLNDYSKIYPQFINNFIIGRYGYGTILFPDLLELLNFKLGAQVKINHRYVEVDTSLNNYTHLAGKKAHVCLHSIWPKDKKNGYFIKDIWELNKLNYEYKLKRACLKMGATYVRYLPYTGTLIFQVPHFSRYKLEDSDDEEIEEVSYTQPFQTKPNLTSDSFARPPLHRSRISNHPDGNGNLFEGDISSFKDSPSEYNFGREENSYLIKRHKNEIISRGKGSRWVLGENMNSTKIDVQPKISRTPNLMSPSLLFNNLENSFTRTVYFPIQMNDRNDNIIKMDSNNDNIIKMDSNNERIQDGFDANERKKSVRFSGEIMNESGNEAKLLFNIIRNDNNDSNEVRDLVDDTSINIITNSLLPDYSIFQYVPYPLPSFISTDAYNINPNSLCPSYRGFRPSWGPGNMLVLPAIVVRGRNVKQMRQSLFSPPVKSSINEVMICQLSSKLDQDTFDRLSSVYESNLLNVFKHCCPINANYLANQSSSMTLYQISSANQQNHESIDKDVDKLLINFTASAKDIDLAIASFDTNNNVDKNDFCEFGKIWNLVKALWGQVPDYNSNAINSDYQLQQARKIALIKWIIKYSPNTMMPHNLNRSYGSENSSLLKSFLQTFNLAQSCESLCSKRNYKTALLMSQSQSPSSNLCTLNGPLRVYQLLTNTHDQNLAAYQENNCLVWVQTLAMHLLFPSNKKVKLLDHTEDYIDRKEMNMNGYTNYGSSIESCLKRYEDSIGLAPGTLFTPEIMVKPNYTPFVIISSKCLTSNIGNNIPMMSMPNECDSESTLSPVSYLQNTFHLLRFFCRPFTYPLSQALSPYGYTMYGDVAGGDNCVRQFGYLNSFKMALFFTSRNLWPLTLDQSRRAALLIDRLIVQSEPLLTIPWLRLWLLAYNWSVNGTNDTANQDREARLIDLRVREKTIKDFSNLSFVSDHLLIVCKKVLSQHAGDKLNEFHCCIKLGDLNSAHSLFINDIAPNTILEGHFRSLKLCLNQLNEAEGSNNLENWRFGESAYQRYLNIICTEQMDEASIPLDDLLQKTEIFLSLIKDCCSLPSMTNSQKLARYLLVQNTSSIFLKFLKSHCTLDLLELEKCIYTANNWIKHNQLGNDISSLIDGRIGKDFDFMFNVMIPMLR
ncbi:uncharacterized protein LOC135922740 isoform X3 [Gordionus sp. m RMFG-2023]|uniref:uncharacterized protein LOC135922740 isoform X3 n=1 Tax=Gordionus sp. m RMFG-2023 TaxID=3053472 RepID=UPI0031FE1BCF